MSVSLFSKRTKKQTDDILPVLVLDDLSIAAVCHKQFSEQRSILNLHSFIFIQNFVNL